MDWRKQGRRLLQSSWVLTLFGLGYLAGQQGESSLAAQTTKQTNPTVRAQTEPDDGNKRVVAYIYKTTPITRDEFADYLIQRYGAERIELFVNKRIIETAAAKRNIDVTPIEIEATIDADCKTLKLERKDYLNQITKQFNKSVFEYKEDVLKPRILLAKMYKDQVQISDEELKKMFENEYGRKVKARIIFWPKGEEKAAYKTWEKIRTSDEEFMNAAKMQADPTLSARAGLLNPSISRWSMTPINRIEDTAFALKEGEVSELIETPPGLICIKSLGFEEAVSGVTFEQVKADLLKMTVEMKMKLEVPKLMESLKAEADPLYILKPTRLSRVDQDREVQKEILPVSGTNTNSPMKK